MKKITSQFDDVFKERLRKSFLVVIETVFCQKFDIINEQPIELRKQIKNARRTFFFKQSKMEITPLYT